MGKQMTYSQKKRAKLDYRAVYFSHNPGLFGCVWFCAYCKKPIVGKQNVQVDHIMPLNNPLGMNRGFNLVAACPVCNNRKSDRVDYRVAQGYVNKLFQSVIFGIQKIVIIAFVGIYVMLQQAVKAFLGILAIPLKSGRLLLVAGSLALYAGIAYFLFKHFF